MEGYVSTMKATINAIKTNKAMVLFSALLVSLTFFFFGPLEILLSSSSEFWFSIEDVLLLIVGATALSMLCMLLIYVFASLIGDKLLVFICSLFGGLGVSMYIQGNWTFVDYGIMDGTPINWNTFGKWSIVNAIIWIVIIVVSVIIVNLFPRKRRFFSGLMAVICGIEILTIVTLLISHQPKDQSSPIGFTNKDQLVLTEKGDNILVILADGFDGIDFLPVLDEEPGFKECFEGFTFYRNTLGTSLFSQESGITLLTGNQLKAGPTFRENINEAFDTSILYDVLLENGYSNYLYVGNSSMLGSDVESKVENFGNKKVEINSLVDAGKMLYRMVAFKYAPHEFKKHFWYTTMDFNTLKDTYKGMGSNFDLYDLVLTQGVKTDSDKKNVYQFYWIQGPHEPATMDRFCSPIEQVANMADDEYEQAQFEQTIGVVRIFTQIISALKSAGVYDNTTIIFTADHGWDLRRNPLFLVKTKNATGEMEISDAPISMIEDYLPTMLYYITGEKKYGKTIYDYEEEMHRERPFYVYDFDSDRNYSIRYDLSYDGMYSAKYELGTELDAKLIWMYGVSGLDLPEEGIWTTAKEAEMEYRLFGEYNNLEISMKCDVFRGAQQVKIYANDHLVVNNRLVGNGDRSFIIPGEYVNEGVLRLKYVLPDAISKHELDADNPDKNPLGLDFLSLSIKSTDAVFDIEAQIQDEYANN